MVKEVREKNKERCLFRGCDEGIKGMEYVWVMLQEGEVYVQRF